jgi:hypothetical protein
MKKILTTLFILTLVAPLGAEIEVKVGGEIWTRLENNSAVKGLPQQTDDAETYTISDTTLNLSELSRLNFTLLKDGKKIGFIQLGLIPVYDRTNHFGTIQHIYGMTECFGLTLLVGKTEPLFDDVWGRTLWSGNQMLIGWGNAWVNRIVQFRVSKKFGDTTIAGLLAQPNIPRQPFYRQHAVLPRLELALTQKFAGQSACLSFLYNSTTSVKEETNVDKQIAVNSFGVALVGKLAFGPVKATLNYYTGTNIQFAVGRETISPFIEVVENEPKLVNALHSGGFIDGEVAIPILPGLSLAGGFGFTSEKWEGKEKSDKMKSTLFAEVRKKLSENMQIQLGYNSQKRSAYVRDKIKPIHIKTGLSCILFYKY